jgi:type IV secretory pathway VirB10-like protein
MIRRNLTADHWIVPSLALGLMAWGACAKGERSAQPSADSAARNLTLAPSDSSAPLHDMPAEPPRPATQPASPPPSRPPAAKPKPAPVAPATRTAAAGTFIDLAVEDTLSSHSTKAGDAFTASVVEDVKDAQGRVVIPAGSTVHGTVAAVKPAPNPNTPGTLTLSLNTITVRGTDYPIEARIDSLETVREGRGVTGGDVAKVGAGAAAGAILGRIIGKNTKGAVIGGVVGAVVGTGVATSSKDSDIVLPKGAHINASLTAALTVRES